MSDAERITPERSSEPATYFAPPDRTPPAELSTRVDIINDHPIVTELLDVVSGLLAVLDDARQVVAVNDAFLQTLGIKDAGQVLGLRPGQILHCVNAEAAPAGCGTTRQCAGCGAVIAIVGALGQNKTVERVCTLTVEGDIAENERVFAVRAQPIVVENNRYVLLFMQDRTRAQRRAALERTFFHDIRNRMTGLLGAAELMAAEANQTDLTRSVRRSIIQLCREVEIQEYLMKSKSARYEAHLQDIPIDQLLEDIRVYFTGHEAADGRVLDLPTDSPVHHVKSDGALLLRVLCNMVLNALEATRPGGTVGMRVGKTADTAHFQVRNQGPIPEEMIGRLFMRNFSTKPGSGRGIGTYSMKLFGEDVLGGKIDFTTSAAEGTTFTFTLPI